MKTLSPELESHLYGQDDHPPAVECWTLYFASGVQRWSSGDLDITFGGNTWTATGKAVAKIRIHQEPGATQVDTVDLEVAPAVGESQAAVLAAWDGIRVVLQRAWLAADNSVVGMMTVFDGIADEPKPGSDVIAVTVTSQMALMQEEVPRRLLQASCPFVLGDAACGVSLASFTTATTIAAGTTLTAIQIPASTPNANVGGWIRITTGTLAGLRRRIRAVSGATITPDLPLPALPAVDSGIEVVRGCPKTLAACRDVFANVARYGGQPYAPQKGNFGTAKSTPPNGEFGAGGGSNLIVQPIGGIFIGGRLTPQYGEPFPLVFGRAKVKPIPVWLGGSQGSAVYTSVKSSETGTGRTADVVLAICLAPITQIVAVYRGQDKADVVNGLARLCAPPAGGRWVYTGSGAYGPPPIWVPSVPGGEYELVTGSSPAAWAHLDGTPSEGVAFTGLAQYRTERLCLDSEGKIPDLAFMVDGLFGQDAHPADVITYLLTDAVNGLGLDPSIVVTDVGPDGTAASSFRRYVDQYPKWRINHAMDARTSIGQAIDEIAAACNSVVLSSEGKIKIVPLGDTAFGTVNGGYVPATTAVVLDEDEVGVEGIEVTEYAPNSSVMTSIPVEYTDVESDGEAHAQEYQDDSAPRPRRGSSVSNPWISHPEHAYALSQILVQRSRYQRMKMKATLGPRWAALDPGDLVSLSDGGAFSGVRARIMPLEEDEDGILEFEAIETPESTAHPIDLTPQSYEGAALDGMEPALTVQETIAATQETAARAWQAADQGRQGGVAESWDWFDLNDWEVVSGSASTLSVQSSGVAGGKVLRNTGGGVRLVHKTLTPYDPARLYQIRIRARRTSGDGWVLGGFVGVAEDGVTLVALDGSNSAGNAHYTAQITADSFTEATAYWKGRATPGTAGGTLAAPGVAHTNVRYLRRLLYFGPTTTQVAEVDTLELLIGDPVAEVAKAIADAAQSDATDALSGLADKADVDFTNVGDGVVVARLFAADVLKTSNYAEDGSSNPTAGAKLDHQGTALKVAPGNLQIGTKVLNSLWFGFCEAAGVTELVWMSGTTFSGSSFGGNGAPTLAWNSTTKRLRITWPNMVATGSNPSGWENVAIFVHRQNAAGGGVYDLVQPAVGGYGSSGIPSVNRWVEVELRDGANALVDWATVHPAGLSFNVLFVFYNASGVGWGFTGLPPP